MHKNSTYLKIIYWIATLLLSGIMLFSAQMYFRKTEMVEGVFRSFHYPDYLVIPLAILKITGVAVILINKIKWLKEWAYAGIFLDLVLASVAHHKAAHPIGLSVYALVIFVVSYVTGKKVRP